MPNPIEFVRVRIKGSGVEKSIPCAKYDLSRDLYTKVQGDAVNSNGDPLPATAVSTETEKKAGQKAASEKENS